TIRRLSCARVDGGRETCVPTRTDSKIHVSINEESTMAPVDTLLSQADSSELIDTARSLFREYADAIGTDLEYQGFAAELLALPEPYIPPSGALLIARNGFDVAGCAGLRRFDSTTGEMK